MSRESSTLILSPNLGCPEIVAPEDLNQHGTRLVVATSVDTPDWRTFVVRAEPSYANEGQAFELKFDAARLLDSDSLAGELQDVGDTRLLMSTFVRSTILPGHTFWAITAITSQASVGDGNLRKVASQARGTLYDLVLVQNGQPLGRVEHALYLRRKNPVVRFIHLTDLHVAARNDLWETEVQAIVPSALTEGKRFVNFNERLRSFIAEANEAADLGQLDLVLALGDLVDFVRLGVADRGPGDNNWSTLIRILTGAGSDELQRNNAGLRVPLFTTIGNHDWRSYPYPPEVNCEGFNISKKCGEELDSWYHDTSSEVGKKIEEVNERLIREGSPILARSWWGTLAGMGVRGLQVGLARLGQRAQAALTKYLRQSLTALIAALLVGSWKASGDDTPLRWALMAGAVVLLVLMLAGQRLLYARLRETLESFIAIETSAAGLADYFLTLNPYFNYAIRLENCYFLVLDTGHDCLPAESFWDEGAKKLGPVSVRDNILGGSPDTMAFYPPNEHYPYSQIAWMERVLARIQADHQQTAGAPRNCRIFVALHTPVANLSKKDRKRADELVEMRGPVKLPPCSSFFDLDGFDIRYGTVNHYLSEFYYLCLGYREGARDQPSGPGIDAVLAGHAHWDIEFKLRKPEGAGGAWNPEALYGRFSEEVEQSCGDARRWWGPLLLQTPACGPPSRTNPDTPYFRYVTVNQDLGVCHLRPLPLNGPLPWKVRAVGA